MPISDDSRRILMGEVNSLRAQKGSMESEKAALESRLASFGKAMANLEAVIQRILADCE